jgi:hypothetical protein
VTRQRVVFASDCDEDGNCPVCNTDYADCSCPGPMQGDVYAYEIDAEGVMWAMTLGK